MALDEKEKPTETTGAAEVSSTGESMAPKEKPGFGSWVKEHKKMVSIAACVAGFIVLGLVSWQFISRHYKLSEADARLQAAQQMAQEMLLSGDEADPDVLAAEHREVKPPPEIPDKGPTTETWDYEKYARGIEEHKTDPYMTKRVDFKALSQGVTADEVWGWVFLPDTGVDYIVMQGPKDDPLKYLWKDVNGNKSDTGSLFVRSKDGLTDDHTIIYGHRLVDHNLFFGPLMHFRDKEGHADAHRYAYTYTDRRVTKWELSYVCSGKNDDDVYFYPYVRDCAEWWDLDQDIKEHAVWSGAEFSMLDHMLVLSTCSAPSATTPDRLYLVYRDVSWWDY